MGATPAPPDQAPSAVGFGSSPALVNQANEYSALRDELRQSKQYVFERPLAIVGVGVAALNIRDVDLGVGLPALLAGLLLFNYGFTMNRLRSASRITAYLQVVHERGLPWWGWETSLRAYRLWFSNGKKAKDTLVNSALKRRAVPDALTYHPAIHQLHIALVSACLLGGAYLTEQYPSHENLAAASILAVIVVLFACEAVRSRPSKTCALIERNVVIWEHVLRDRPPVDTAEIALGDSPSTVTL